MVLYTCLQRLLSVTLSLFYDLIIGDLSLKYDRPNDDLSVLLISFSIFLLVFYSLTEYYNPSQQKIFCFIFLCIFYCPLFHHDDASLLFSGRIYNPAPYHPFPY